MCTGKNVYSTQAHEKIRHLFVFRVSPSSLKFLNRQNKNVRLSYFNNQQQEKKVDSRPGIFMSGLSKVDPFSFAFVSLKVSAFLCPSVTDIPFDVVLCFTREERFDSFPKWIVEVDLFFVQTTNSKYLVNKAPYKLLCNCILLIFVNVLYSSTVVSFL